jgi:hypothetical protein
MTWGSSLKGGKGKSPAIVYVMEKYEGETCGALAKYIHDWLSSPQLQQFH